MAPSCYTGLEFKSNKYSPDSLSVGYYPGVSAPPGFMTLIVPCRLGEVELALALEMFITVNATVLLHLTEMSDSCLSITLRRYPVSLRPQVELSDFCLTQLCLFLFLQDSKR